MAYRLKIRKSVRREVKRVLINELQSTLMLLRDSSGARGGTSIHESRKHLKKARALMRLVKPAAGGAFYKRENAVLRKAAQLLSPIRDAHVRVQSLKSLVPEDRSRRASPAIARIQRTMDAALDRELTADGRSRQQAAVHIELALRGVTSHSLRRLDRKSLVEGLRLRCRKARRALKAAQRVPSDINLHELRKRIKDLGYDLRLLRGGCPPPIKRLLQHTDELSEMLGDHHDIAMLLAARATDARPEDWDELEKVVSRRRTRLQRDGLRLAARMLCRKPSEFADLGMRNWTTS